MKILVTTICFIQPNKIEQGSEIYSVFANRLIESTIKNTPFDIRVATNRPELFSDSLAMYKDRFSLLIDYLEDKHVWVGAFNQLLKFLALKDISDEYDYVLYLDCDSSFIDKIDEHLLMNVIEDMEKDGFNGMVNRSYTTYLMDLLKQHDSGEQNIFSAKFVLHGLTSSNIPDKWKDATLPCEHILFLKNEGDRLKIMSEKIEEFNKVVEAQMELPHIACIPDMEALELGIGAKEAGYVFKELDTYMHVDVLQVQYNGSNWEKVKL